MIYVFKASSFKTKNITKIRDKMLKMYGIDFFKSRLEKHNEREFKKKQIRERLLNDNYSKSLIKTSKIRKTYIMFDENTGYYKIGYSIDPMKRERTLQAEKPTISLLYVCNMFVEKQLHDIFKEKRVRGEWFDLSDSSLSFVIDKFKFKKVNIS